MSKKTSPWVWVGLGCGGVAVIGVVVVAVGVMIAARKATEFAQEMEANPTKVMAEMMVRTNPDVELVDSSEESLTVKDKKSGETFTVTFTQDENGQIKFTGPDGEITFDGSAAESGDGAFISAKSADGKETFSMTAGEGDVPQWVPKYPGAEEEKVAWAVKANANGKDAVTGAVAFKTDDGAKKAIERYATILEKDGYEVNKVIATGKEGTGGQITGIKDDRTVSAIIGQDKGKTQIVVHYAHGEE